MKTTLILVAIFLAFGVVGRMDYEDELAFEAASRGTQVAAGNE